MESKLKGGLMEYRFLFLHRDSAKQITTSLLSSVSILTALYNNKGVRLSILLNFHKIFAGTDVANAKHHTKENYHTNQIP